MVCAHPTEANPEEGGRTYSSKLADDAANAQSMLDSAKAWIPKLNTTSKDCIADHGKNVGDPTCCGQPTLVTDTAKVCDSNAPFCVGYVSVKDTTPTYSLAGPKQSCDAFCAAKGTTCDLEASHWPRCRVLPACLLVVVWLHSQCVLSQTTLMPRPGWPNHRASRQLRKARRLARRS